MIANASSNHRFRVIDLDTGAEIPNVHFADDEAGYYYRFIDFASPGPNAEDGLHYCEFRPTEDGKRIIGEGKIGRIKIVLPEA
jgi:hypothetical protein